MLLPGLSCGGSGGYTVSPGDPPPEGVIHRDIVLGVVAPYDARRDASLHLPGISAKLYSITSDFSRLPAHLAEERLDHDSENGCRWEWQNPGISLGR